MSILAIGFSILGLGAFLYLVKLWLDYKKVQVKTVSYPITLGITLLFLAFMALTGILSLSDKLLLSILDKLGIVFLDLNQTTDYKLILIATFVVFAVAIFSILKISSKSSKHKQSIGDINTGTGNPTIVQNTYSAPSTGDNSSVPQQVINNHNYYGINPEEVERLKKELSLKDEVIEQLIHNAKENEAKISKRTQAFEEEVKKYQKLVNSLSNDDIDQQAKQQLEEANWDEAKKLLEQANQKDQGNIAKRNLKLAQINELTLNYPKAIEYYEKALKTHPQDLSAWSSLAKLYQRFGDTQQAYKSWQKLQYNANKQQEKRWYNIAISGEAYILAKQADTALALKKYEEAHQYFLAQLSRDPNNSDWQHDLSVSFIRIGDMYKVNGEGDKAIGAYQDSLEIRETLASRAPNNSDWQCDLSISYNRIGDMHKANGEGDKAIGAYQDALKIAETLASRAPNNSNWQCDLSVSFNKIGDMHKANGDGDKAIGAYQDALKIAETLASRYPNNSDWQRDLSVSFNNIGDMHKANGKGDKAMGAYQDALKIVETQANRDPNNLDWQRGLSVSFNKIGDMHKANGEGDKAIGAYQDALKIAETLASRDPNNSVWQHDLSISYERIGSIHQANGDGDKAIGAYQDSLEIRETLASRAPNNSDWQRDLSVSFDNIGDMHIANGEGDKAIGAYQDALEIRKKLASRDPNNSELQRDLIVSYVKMSEVLPDKYIYYTQKALTIAETLYAENHLYPKDHWLIDELKRRLKSHSE